MTDQQAARLTRSTRDPEQLRRRLREWLSRALGDPGLEVLDLASPASNGMSSETLLFTAAWRDGGTPVRRALAARVAPDPANVPVFPTYDLAAQFEVLRRLHAHGRVPVPEPLWFEPDAEPLGAPFFVMAQVAGRVPPDNLPYTFGGWLADATPAERRELQDRSVEVLAAVHATPAAERDFAFLALDRPEPTPLTRLLGDLRDYYEWVVADGLRSPLVERCLGWLEDHVPEDEGPAVLCWGDARIGNVLYQGYTPAAVLDWEMAHLGPREVDIGWFVFLHRSFDDLAHLAGLPGLPDFCRRDDVAETYRRASGHLPRDLDFYTMLAAVRYAAILGRTMRRSIHFGDMPMPADVDDLILHRAALEAMLAGTYWS